MILFRHTFVVLVWFRITLITCKNYNYIFVFVKVMPETLLVPFYPDAVYRGGDM